MSNFPPNQQPNNPLYNNPTNVPQQPFGNPQPFNQPFNPYGQPQQPPYGHPQQPPIMQPQGMGVPPVGGGMVSTTFSPQELQYLNTHFRLQWENTFGRIFTNQNRVMVCEIKQSYVPYDEFQVLIHACEQVIAGVGGCIKFIFEKRALRSFHQPSMEWYYTVWKPKMYQQYGLGVHRKLFPQEKWFLKCIEAGRHEIRTKHPNSIAHSLDVRVCMTLEEAVNS